MQTPKIVLITGVSTGIGKSLMLLLSKSATNVRVIALTKRQPEFTLPNNVEVYQVDLTDHTKSTKVVNHILKKYGHIDVLVNNAGNGWRGMVEDTSIEEAKNQLELNVWAVIHLTKLVLPVMRARRSGHIINISSVASHINYATIGYYSATKAFLEKISEVMAVELEPWDVKVSIMAPGAVKTNFGHSMVNIKAYGKGSYKESYALWAARFETMFRKPLSSDEAALQIVRIIEKPAAYSFLTRRDAFYCYMKKVLSRQLFTKFLLKRYMNL